MEITTLAIDPGLNCMGYAFMAKERVIKSGTIRSKGDTITEKLFSISVSLKELAETYQPQVAYLEIPQAYSFKRSMSSGSDNKQLNQESLPKLNRAIGAIMLTLAQCKIDLVEITVAEWKGSRKKSEDKPLASLFAGRVVTKDEGDAIMLCLFGQQKSAFQKAMKRPFSDGKVKDFARR